MIKIGDRVQVGSRIGAKLAWATVVAILPGVGGRPTMYRVRLEQEITAPTLTPTPNESWVDEGMVYGPFIDQATGWND